MPEHVRAVAYRERCQAMSGPRIGRWSVVLCVGCYGRWGLGGLV